jgi:hypothetical protein
MKLIVSLALVIALIGAARPLAAEPKPPLDPDVAKSDIALLKDEDKAIVEFQRRLHDQVTYRNGVLVIVDRTGTSPGIVVMPATVMWAVDCSDNGLGVTFGAGTGDNDNGIMVQLTNAALSDEKCQHIAPPLGEALLALVKGN